MADLALVADIGGTNTRVALTRGPGIEAASVRRYANTSADGIGTILQRYLDETNTSIDAIDGACVAGAGPVRNSVVTLTNLGWRIDRGTLAEALTAYRLAVLNDLQAQAHALGHLDPDALTEILPNRDPTPQAAKLVIGMGTGFNVAPVYDTIAGRIVPPSEAGHIALGDAGGPAAPVIAALRAKLGFAAVEEALSGRGIGQVHAALHGTVRDAASIMAGLDAGERDAEDTVRTVVQILGAVVGDLALLFLPFGGIYLCGGVSRSLAPHFARFGFADAMRAKGRFAPLIEEFGVSLIADDYAALRGCAAHL
ncbi:MAG: ROK family protein, partial [Pseudomonadota bacterium]